jgi:hypothetical protein
VATLATVAVSVLLPSSILSAGSDNASLMAQTQVRNPARGYASNVKAASDMSRCMATWDPSTQMSKQEWRETCKRTVKKNPGLYSKPF